MGLLKIRRTKGQPETSQDAFKGRDPESNGILQNDFKTKAGSCNDVWTSRKLFFAVAILLTTVVIPCIIYVTLFNKEKPQLVFGRCTILPHYRIPCVSGEDSVGATRCLMSRCCWNTTTHECFHSVPARYRYVKETDTEGIVLRSEQEITTVYTRSLNLTAAFVPLTEFHLRIVIAERGKMELPTSNLSLKNTAFNVTIYEPYFLFDIFRNTSANGVPILSSTRAPLIASDSYWEIGIQCPEDGSVFGLGQLQLLNTTPHLLYSSKYRANSMPVFICLDIDGNAHGIVIQNSGPLEVHQLAKSNILALRSLSNAAWDIHLFAGPTPRQVMLQMTEFLGRPKLPSYLALGLHVCRDVNSTDVDTMLKEFNNFHDKARTLDFPYETDCLDENFLTDFSLQNVSSLLTGVISNLQSDKKKLLLSLSPQVLTQTSLCLRSEDNSDIHYSGFHRGKTVFYPDFFDPESGDWLLKQWNNLLIAAPDLKGMVAGCVLQDNWPANLLDQLPEALLYIPRIMNRSLSQNTVWWQARHSDGTPHHAVHNSYSFEHALKMSEALVQIFPKQNSLVLSASCHLGSGAVGGCHQQHLVNVEPSWATLKQALVSVLGLGLAGVPLASGGSVCGSIRDYDEAVCLKWYLLAASLPIMRVSSGIPLRDPTSFVHSEFIQNGIRDAIKLRYSFLPYYFTLFQESSVSGSPVARPMFFEFPADRETWPLDEQFMVGSALLVAPVLHKDAISVSVYLPRGPALWYMLAGGHMLQGGDRGSTHNITVREVELMVLLRGGHILPTQEPGDNAESSKELPYKLTVGLDCSSGVCSAVGEMFLPGPPSSTLTFTADATSVTVRNPITSQCLIAAQLRDIRVFGVTSTVTKVTLIPEELLPEDQWNYFAPENVLIISRLTLDLCQESNVINWEY